MHRIQLSSASAKILIMLFGNNDGKPDVNSVRIPRQDLQHLSSNLRAKAKRRFRVSRPLAIFDLKSWASQPVNKGLSVR